MFAHQLSENPKCLELWSWFLSLTVEKLHACLGEYIVKCCYSYDILGKQNQWRHDSSSGRRAMLSRSLSTTWIVHDFISQIFGTVASDSHSSMLTTALPAEMVTLRFRRKPATEMPKRDVFLKSDDTQQHWRQQRTCSVSPKSKTLRNAPSSIWNSYTHNSQCAFLWKSLICIQGRCSWAEGRIPVMWGRLCTPSSHSSDIHLIVHPFSSTQNITKWSLPLSKWKSLLRHSYHPQL